MNNHSAETNELLFSKSCDDFADDSLVSFTDEQLQLWNGEGWEQMQQQLGKDSSQDDDPTSTEKLWLTSAVAEDLAKTFLESADDEVIEAALETEDGNQPTI